VVDGVAGHGAGDAKIFVGRCRLWCSSIVLIEPAGLKVI